MEYKKIPTAEKMMARMLMQNNVAIDQLGITHKFFHDNRNKIVELYKIADVVAKRKYE